MPQTPSTRRSPARAGFGLGSVTLDLLCAFAAITAISICLIGYGESRAAKQCAQMTTSAFSQE